MPTLPLGQANGSFPHRFRRSGALPRVTVPCASQPNRCRGTLATIRFRLLRRAAAVEDTPDARANGRPPVSAIRLATGGNREKTANCYGSILHGATGPDRHQFDGPSVVRKPMRASASRVRRTPIEPEPVGPGDLRSAISRAVITG